MVRGKEAAKALVAQGVKEAFVSIGATGLVYANSSLCGLVAPLDLPVVNVSGAGDAAAAGIATATIYGYDTAMKAAMAAAYASCCAASAMTVAEGLTLESLIATAGRVRNKSL